MKVLCRYDLQFFFSYSIVLAGDDTYRLVGVVSHLGGATHSGHYMSDVYSVDRDRWFHYDDHRVSCVQEADCSETGTRGTATSFSICTRTSAVRLDSRAARDRRQLISDVPPEP